MRAIEATPTGGQHRPLMRAHLPTLAVIPSLEPAGTNGRKPKLVINPAKFDQPDHKLTNAEPCKLLVISPVCVASLCSVKAPAKIPKSWGWWCPCPPCAPLEQTLCLFHHPSLPLVFRIRRPYLVCWDPSIFHTYPQPRTRATWVREA